MDADDSYVSIESTEGKKKNENCVIRLFRKILKMFYPSVMIKAQTKAAEDLRCIVRCSTMLHIFFFVFCLALVGPKEMFVNMMLALWAYSCYLTLYDMEILMYLLFLASATIGGLFYSVETIN